MSLLVSGDELSFDFVVFAVPFDILSRILPQTPNTEPLRQVLARFETSPITGIHLWFDRQITDLDHAVLLDRTIQWMFHKSKLLAATPKGAIDGAPVTASLKRCPDTNPASSGNFSGDAPYVSAPEPTSASEANGSYVELVVSSSKTLVEKSRAEIIELSRWSELREFFPGARDANLVKSTVIKEVHATYSPQPGVDSLPSACGNGLAKSFSSRRLDCDRMACHHGRRSPQRIHRGGIRGPKCWNNETRPSLYQIFPRPDLCGSSGSLRR